MVAFWPWEASKAVFTFSGKKPKVAAAKENRLSSSVETISWPKSDRWTLPCFKKDLTNDVFEKVFYEIEERSRKMKLHTGHIWTSLGVMLGLFLREGMAELGNRVLSLVYAMCTSVRACF